MKIPRIFWMTLIAVASWSASGILSAQDQNNARGQSNAQAQTGRAAGEAARGYQIIGADIQNAAREEIGEIQNLAINPQSGQIEYVVVTLGEVEGMGDNYYAVPWKAFEWRAEKGKSSPWAADASPVPVLKVDPQQMQNAPGFSEENWPNFASAEWKQRNDSHFLTAQRPGGVQQR